MAASRLSLLQQQIDPSSHETAAHLNTQTENTTGAYKVNEEPRGSVRSIRIITIGAGASGLNILHTLREKLTEYEIVVYEKNSKVGGTWYENRYPGCKCDIPSHNYQFSWKPNPEWSSFFSPAAEIEDYLCRVCDEEQMNDNILLKHEVVGAFWNEAKASWTVKIRNLDTNIEF
ncbi:hypothetical protein G7054_g9231 [Neopestalotiopsis clavispora]|nr:hypothetical protein G7054_g9231 [Neopestalotiopsis clavispora]